MSSITSRQILGTILTVLLPVAASHATVRYVALDGSGANGQSWATAYRSIDAALGAASTVAGDQIRVKQGTYGTGATIYVTKAVTIVGGYSGVGDTRELDPSKTIISGLNTASHCLDISANAVISGFTITKGRANGSRPSDEGGGMYIHQCSAQVDNCLFKANMASYIGGAIALDNAAGTVISNCSFIENWSTYVAGAILCYYSDATIDTCHFEGNKTGDGTTDGYGGGIYNDTCAPTILNCDFSGNSAQYGAGIANYNSAAHVEGCSFTDCNSTTIGGGGVYNWGGTPTISNCLFQDNRVSHRGGGIFDKSLGTIVNCILWNNRSMTYGGAIHVDPSADGAESGATIANCVMYGNTAYQGGGCYSDNATPTLVNCILWGNTGWDQEVPAEIYSSTWVFNRKPVVTYCDVAGDDTFPGTGNLRSDPKFLNAPGGDFHLQSGSPCIDHGTNSAPGLPSTDYENRPRIRDGDDDGLAVVDMGAFEVQGYSLSDHVHSGEILQGMIYDNPTDATAAYMFMTEFQTDDSVQSIQFRSPAGNTFNIPATEHTTSGNVETHHVVVDGVHTWQYWASFDSAAGLNSYGDGTYVITYRLGSGVNKETQVGYNLPGGAPIPQPSQKPNVTSPAYDASVPSPVVLAWDACTDGSANSVYVTLINADTDQTVAGGSFDKSATYSSEYTLGGGTYDAEVSFGNLQDTTDNTGIPFEIGKGVMVGHRFSVTLTAVYRFWSPVGSTHFYTINVEERDWLIANYAYYWTYEGIAYHAAATANESGLLPVYRFWSGSSHFYTISEEERDFLVANYSWYWNPEGIAFYAYPEGQQPADTKAVYRFWSPTNGSHFYTISAEEREWLIANYSWYWVDEGIAFYTYE